MYEIILGRNASDRKKLGTNGTILIGKHYVTMEREKVLANPIYLDVNGPHAILIAGKRGSGKSYTLGVIVEGIAGLPAEIKQNITTVLFDTMGIYWTMKYPNFRDDKLLQEYDLKPESLDPVVYVPIGKFDEYAQKGLPADKIFAIKPSEVSVEQWSEIFGIELLSPEGLLLERAIENFEESYSLDELIAAVEKDEDGSDSEKMILKNRLKFIEKWGLFDEKGMEIDALLEGGQTVIIDLSAYAEVDGGEKIKALAIGFVSMIALKHRMAARKTEELEIVKEGSLGESSSSKIPLLQIIVDEAHEFLPKEGKTMASMPLIQILREGRQPGISLILATQQPGKIHTDVMTQSDIVISHRLTSKIDIDALNVIMQSYASSDLQKYIDNLPREKGTAIVLDDTNEKIYPLRIKPRISWHGGSDPHAIRGNLMKELTRAVDEKVKATPVDKNLK